MTQKSSKIQQQYQGYLQTPLLWDENPLFELHQLILTEIPTTIFCRNLPENLRLGKRVEHFVFNELSQYNSIKLLAENIQIQDDYRTIGELDLLALNHENPIHVEVVYKFYIYDDTVGNSYLEHWIGPNRKDSLVEKLTKLRDKQLPLLYRKETQTALNNLQLHVNNTKQYVYFKAQLFLPLGTQEVTETLINKDCIVGYYIKTKQLEQFHHCKFYILNKADWLIKPHTNVSWMSYSACFTLLHAAQNNQLSECCWIKHPNGVIDKCFVVWW